LKTKTEFSNPIRVLSDYVRYQLTVPDFAQSMGGFSGISLLKWGLIRTKPPIAHPWSENTASENTSLKSVYLCDLRAWRRDQKDRNKPYCGRWRREGATHQAAIWRGGTL